MDPITMTAIENIVLKTGLKLDTVLDLLRSGWSYTEKIDEPSRWVSPLELSPTAKLEQFALKNH